MREKIANGKALTRVSLASTPDFASPNTVFLSVVVAPVMAVLILVAVVSSLDGGDARMAAYAGVLVTAAGGALAGINAALAYERNVGVIPTVLAPRFGSTAYWCGKVMPANIASGLVGAASLVAVFALSADRDVELLGRALSLLGLALMSGTVLGLCAAVGALLMSDPYLIANITTSMWALMVGVVAPLSDYPGNWEVVGQRLPMAHCIGLLRGEDWASVGGELAALAPWCLLLGGLVMLARRRLTSGADLSYL